MDESHRKLRDGSWDFRDADTKELTHCLHAYPAMMIPQIARGLLERYGAEGGWLLDPYCGTGTSLVEASVYGMHAVGCDVNGLARLIARAKTAPVPLADLDAEFASLSERVLHVAMNGSVPECPVPGFSNRDFWFAPDVTRRLAFLRAEIQALQDDGPRRVLWTAFSETVRECSFTRNSEFKLYRMQADKMAGFDPDVFGVFLEKASRNRAGLAEFIERRRDVSVTVCDSNTVDGETPPNPPSTGFDLVVTSPPYGDSSTTVAYGQYSRLSAEWIGVEDARSVDSRSMGGRTSHAELDLGPVAEPVERIAASDAKRARQVAGYYEDLARSISTVADMLGEQAVTCYVVGNRRVKGVTLPTDEFIVWAFERHGLGHVETIVRSIPNKRMPARNSPSNVPGRTDVTMHEENIVVCRR